MDHFRDCNAFSSVNCSPVVTCWERANLLALLYVMLNCVCVTLPCGVLGQVWCLIVSILIFVYILTSEASMRIIFYYLFLMFVLFSRLFACSPVVAYWEMADLLALLYVMFYCVYVTFHCGVLGQVWCLIVSIPDPCLLSYLGSLILCFNNNRI